MNGFAFPENTAGGVIALDGRMVERLHHAKVETERLLAQAGCDRDMAR